MIKLSGILKYDPVRKGFKKSNKCRTLIIDLARDDIDLYYQWFLLKQYGTWLSLQRPMFGNHITIVKGDETGFKSQNWGLHEGKRVTFLLSPVISKTHTFWSLPVIFPEGNSIRNDLQLNKKMNFHLTIGRQYDWQPI